LVTLSLASLPSLGVSSLDLGRTDLRAAPFISLIGMQVPPDMGVASASNELPVIVPDAPTHRDLADRQKPHFVLQCSMARGRAVLAPSFRCSSLFEQQRQCREDFHSQICEGAYQLLEVLALGKTRLLEIEATVHLQLQ
jgi:hypothetical protein